MAHGIEIYNAAGQLTMGTSDTPARFVSSHSVTLGPGSVVNVTVPGMDTSGDWFIVGGGAPGVYALLGSGSFQARNDYVGTYTIPFEVYRRKGTPSLSGYGFHSVSDSGYTQIDGTVSTWLEVARGSNVASGADVTNAFYGTPTMLFVRPSASTGTVQADSSAVGSFSAKTTAGTWDWVQYMDPANITPTNHYGLRVYGSSGAMVFDDAYPILRIIGGMVASTSGTTNATLPAPASGQRPYVSLDAIASPTSIVQVGPLGQFMSLQVAFNSDTSITTTNAFLSSGPPINQALGESRNVHFISA